MPLSTADCHNDLLIGCLHQRERGIGDPFGDFWLGQLRQGGVVLQVLPVYVEEQFVGEGALRRSLMLLEEAGVKVGRVTTLSFVASAVIAAFAGIVLTAGLDGDHGDGRSHRAACS